VAFYLNNYTRTDDLVSAVTEIRYGGNWPNLSAALTAVRSDVFVASNGARESPSVLRLAVVLVTETPSKHRSSTLMEARAAADMDIGIVTIGIGTFVDRQLLSSITSYPSNKNMFVVSSVRNIPDLVDPVKRIICSGTFCYINCICQFVSCISDGNVALEKGAMVLRIVLTAPTRLSDKSIANALVWRIFCGDQTKCPVIYIRRTAVDQEHNSVWTVNAQTRTTSLDPLYSPLLYQPTVQVSDIVTFLVAWHNGRTLLFDRRTFPVLRSTCSWQVTTYVGKPSVVGQPTRPTQPFILSG